MSAAIRVAAAGLVRSPGRTLGRIVVLAAAVALLGSMLLFVGHSLRTMTGSAVRGVPLDWQGPVASYAQAKKVAAGVARQPGLLQASATATAPFDGAQHSGPGGSTSAGHGSVLAVPPTVNTRRSAPRARAWASSSPTPQVCAASAVVVVGMTNSIPHARADSMYAVPWSMA